jgi:hypothetical protein
MMSDGDYMLGSYPGSSGSAGLKDMDEFDIRRKA